jgi:hypothetical protein
MGPSAPAIVATTSWLIGNMEKIIPNGTTGNYTYVFAIGYSTYAPVSATLNGVSMSADGAFGWTTNTGVDHSGIANSVIDPNHSANRTWSFTGLTNGTATSLSGTFTFTATDLDAGTTANKMIVGQTTNGGTSWTYPTLGTRTSTTTPFSAATVAASDFQLGQPPAPTVTTNPSSTTICSGTNTSFTAAATGYGTVSVQWWVNNGSGFTSISNGGTSPAYSGATTNTLTINNAPASINGYIYHAVYTNDGGTATSTDATLSVNAAATVNAGVDQTICESAGTVSLSGTTGGGASSSTWTTNGSGTFDDAASLTAIYTPSSTDISNGTVTLTLTTDDPSGPCPSVSDNMVVTIHRIPTTANAGSDQTLGCNTFSTTLAGNTPTYGTGTWTGSATFGNIHTPTTTASA